MTKGAIKWLFQTAKTLSKRANIVNAKPITFPSVNAMIGFLLLIMASVRLNRNLDDPFKTSGKSPNYVTRGWVKFVRSFPEEKFPPYPLKTMNLMSGIFYALFMDQVKVAYISMVKALYLLDRLNLIFIKGGVISTIILVFFKGSALKIQFIFLQTMPALLSSNFIGLDSFEEIKQSKLIEKNSFSLQLMQKFVINFKKNFTFIMQDPKTLSATQIRYLRIGPRVNQSKVLKKQLIEQLQAENRQQGAEFLTGQGSLNKIPKFGYNQLSKTVTNFGVLINQNFGNSSTLHQMQKFGKLAKQVDKIMQNEKDKPLDDNKKNSGSRINQKQDKRTFLKSIYNYQGEKIFVVLHSFSIQAIGENYKEIIPFSYMKLLVSKVGSSKLSRVFQAALRFQTQTVELNYEKLQQKAPSVNSEQKYQNLAYKFEKIGTQFKINLPFLQFSHIESDFKSTYIPSNKQILQIVNQEFENVHDMVYKYFDHDGFSRRLGLNKLTQQEQSHDQNDQNQKQQSFESPINGGKYQEEQDHIGNHEDQDQEHQQEQGLVQEQDENTENLHQQDGQSLLQQQNQNTQNENLGQQSPMNDKQDQQELQEHTPGENLSQKQQIQ